VPDMNILVECVPNFSEGKRQNVLEELIKSASPAKLLDMQSDSDHNRSVMTLVGSPGELKEAAISFTGRAIELIDLNYHKGEHPRMGAVDVIPFVPVSGCTVKDCVDLAVEVAKELADRYQLPIFLYEQAAKSPERKNLSDLRQGQFEGLRELIGSDPSRTPDFGPNKIHPTAGVTAVGSRRFLIAYNVNLKTDDIKIAKNIARRIREKNGGLPGIKALGMFIETQNMAQVSMNVCDYNVTSLKKVFYEVKKLAQQLGTDVNSSEVVGLSPRAALPDEWIKELRLENFNDSIQIIENRLN